MQFVTNDTKTYTPKSSEDEDLPEQERTYLVYGKVFNSFDEALEAAKRAAYHAHQKQTIKLIVAEINPIIERLETDFSVDPSVFKE